MEEWISVTQLSKTLEIPETTIRRYLNNFEEYFRWEQVGRGKKYHPSSVEILQRVAVLYDSDRGTAEIKKILADEYAFSVEEDGVEDITTNPPAYDISGKLDEFQQKQEEFNKQLLQKLHEQQKYINELLENQGKDIQEAKRLSSGEERRIERFEQIMLEHKVKKMLEKEAIDLWKEKPEEERVKKVGWIRKEEDRNKREEFVKNYVDENFEDSLRKEMDFKSD